uniref:Uncharacterized protein n=1 Tax=Rhizophora mucronata TaxID=61149 RepID=A0A2P2PT35_RHIMU
MTMRMTYGCVTPFLASVTTSLHFNLPLTCSKRLNRF